MVDKLLHISAFLVGITIPINTKLGNISLFFFILISIIRYVTKKEKLLFKNKLFFIFSTISLFVLCVISNIYTIDLESSINTLGRRSSFILLPISFVLLNNHSLFKIKNYAFTGLAVGCLFSGCYLLTIVLSSYFSNKESFNIGFDLFNYYHTYHNFTAPLKIHPTYLGSFFLISIALIFSVLIKSKKIKKNIFYVILIGFLILIELFINSRVILFLLILLLVSFVSYFMFYLFKKNKLLFILSTIFILTTSYFAFHTIKNTYIFYRFSEELAWETSVEKNTKINDDNGGDSRLARWHSILKVIQDEPFLGYGAGNEKKVLASQFEKDGLVFSLESKYDSHNQYLSYGVQFGIFGIILLFIYMFGNIYWALRNRDIVSFTLSISLGIICVFENYLNTNTGITFIAFWSNLLLILNLQKNV